MPNKNKVAVNGYGVIGKRVADAVRAQEDMELLGVSDVTTYYRVATAIGQGISVGAAAKSGESSEDSVSHSLMAAACGRC